MKYTQLIGVVAAIILVVACTLNWTWYPDLKQYFTGFYSLDNSYGKPGKAFAVLAAIAMTFYLLPRVWAKRWNLIVCGLNLAYAVKTFILFTSCYRGICPVKQPGIWIMMTAAMVMMVAALLPGVGKGRR